MDQIQVLVEEIPKLPAEQVFGIGVVLFCALVGVMSVMSFARTLIHFIYRTYLRAPHNLRKLYGVGGWACVTGATDGIGRAVSFELAKRGYVGFCV